MGKWETSLKVCKTAYDLAKPAIDYVKSKVMKYQEEVEEAQSKAQDEYEYCLGDFLDSTKEQEEDDCLNEGTHEPADFTAIHPDDLTQADKKFDDVKGVVYKKIELDSLD